MVFVLVDLVHVSKKELSQGTLAGLGDRANFYFLGKFFKNLGRFFLGNILFFSGQKKPRKLIISGHILPQVSIGFQVSALGHRYPVLET